MERKSRKPCGIKGIYVLFALGVFAFLLVFFLGYRPITLDNMDDWTYISYTRNAVPKWDYWNPARILPEILMPLCAQFGVWFVMPLVGDYVMAITIALTAAVCLLVTLYICAAAYLLRKLMGCSAGMTVLLSSLFLILHFRSWMSPWIPSRHLFYSWCATTYYYYTVPALINLSLMLLLEAHRGGCAFMEDDHLIAKGFLVIALYLAVFSNLFSSAILAVYAFCCAAENAVKTLKSKDAVGRWFRESALHIGILLTWLVSALFEISGGRARSMGSGGALIDQLKMTVTSLLETLERMEDTTFWLCAGLIAAGFAAALFFGKKENEARRYLALLGRHLFCAAATLAFLVLLSAATQPVYIERVDVLIGVMAHVLLAAMLSLAYLVMKWKKLVLFVPLTAFIIGFDVLYGIESFAHSTTGGIRAQTNIQINQAIMQQILEADKQELDSVTVKVPQYGDGGINWPYTINMGGRMVTTLTNHGMIEHLNAIYIQPDAGFYSTFDIK